MNPIRAVLFDFGNTLFAHDPLTTTLDRLARTLGVPMDPPEIERTATDIESAAHTDEELRHLRDLDAEVWQARWTLLYGIADRHVAGLGAALLADMHDPAHWMPYLDTVRVLTELRRSGVRVGVVSNTGWFVPGVFAGHGVPHLVDEFTLSYQAGFTKPDARIFAAACASLGVLASDTLMVGDDPVADSGATVVGMRTLLLPAAPPGADNGVDAVLRLVG